MTLSRFAVLGFGFAAGCGSPADTPAPVPVAVVSTPAPAPVLSPPVVPPPVAVPAPQPVLFAIPDDLGGKAVSRATEPTLPPLPPAPPTGKPKVRVSDADRGELPLLSTGVGVAPLPLKPPAPAKLTPPPETVPVALGGAASAAVGNLPDRAGVRAPSAVNPGATDVPLSGRPLPDRAPLADPTADLSGSRVVKTPIPVPDVRPWFARFAVPDPFELAEHLKGKLPADAELGTAPAPVPPAKP
jgi:hypothetical protein